MSRKREKVLMLNDNEIDDLIGLLDGCLGTSESDDFNKVFKPILKMLEKIQRAGKVNR